MPLQKNISMICKGARRYLWLVGIWAFTALVLWIFWRQQPRLSFEVADVPEIVAVTPDGCSMVTFTLQTDEKNIKYIDRFPSGPIQVWDLSTGRRRTIELSEQNESPANGSPQNRPEDSIDAELWRVSCPAEPISGRSCHLVQTNHRGERWAVEIDLDQGITAKTRLPDLQLPVVSTSPEMSRKGRWIADLRTCEIESREPSSVLRIIDATTGLITKDFTGLETPHIYFSDDEKLLAVVEQSVGQEYETTIWQLEPLNRLQSMNRNLYPIKFSPCNQWFACVEYPNVVLVDTKTGATLNRFPIKGARSDQFQFVPRQFRFVPDEHFLIGYDYHRGFTSGWAGPHCYISEVRVWDLITGQCIVRRKPAKYFYFDPNLCEDGWSDLTTPKVLRDDNRVFDLQSDQTILTIPNKTTVELVSSENGMAIFKKNYRDSALHQALQKLSSWKIPIPDFLWENTDGLELMVCDIPTGRIRSVLPVDDYIVDSRSLAMTRDGKTLITMSDSPSNQSTIVRVWDLSAFQLLMGPMVWSMLTPISCLTWRFLRRSDDRSN